MSFKMGHLDHQASPPRAMAKMGGSPPHFEGKNFTYQKVRMGAYLDAIAPEVWIATKTG